MPLIDCFYIALFKNCGRGSSIIANTCLISVVGDDKGCAPCKIPLL